MSVIHIPRKHHTQPQGRVQIDWANPLTAHIALVVLHSQGGIFDLVSGLHASMGQKVAGGSTVGADGRYSTGAEWAGKNLKTSTSDYAGDFTYLSFSAPSAVATRGVLVASCSVGRQNYFFSNTNGEYGATTGRLALGGYDNAARFVMADSVIDGRPHVFIGARLSGVGVLSVDGVDVASGSLGTAALGQGSNRFSVERLYGYTGYGDATTAHYLTAAWDRGLTLAERSEIAAAPYQIFRADPVRIYSLPSGPVSVAINSITASNITQTGARITLGLTR